MLVLLSPAKTQDFSELDSSYQCTKPQAMSEIKALVKALKQYKPSQLAKILSVSAKLSELNYQRYQDFNPNRFDASNAKPAIFALQGDAYRSLDVSTLSKPTINYMQKHLIILSGLYGYLRPLDLMQAYRLEMKTALKTPKAKNLYEFWGDKITKALNSITSKQKHKFIINLASNEYFNAIQTDKLKAELITVQFKENKSGTYKTIGINAKRARGAMTRYIMEKRVKTLAELKKFNWDKYRFNSKMSDVRVLVFTR
ncbi:MAG: peroxide stress protein YaaA [Gammaproteobacteria bacterium]|nr:peroxide stress protein YaaA [Gammaproteobacteria bacterium]